MPAEDFRINASVRTILVRFWVDRTQLDHGSVNGVVYLHGKLWKEFGRTEPEGNKLEADLIFLARRLEREFRDIRGVRDVVFNLENLSKVRGRWACLKAG